MDHVTEKNIKSGKNITLVGALVNVLLIFLKLMTGIFGHSQALIADAIHSVSDLFTDIAVLIGLRVGRKAPDEKHPFGHARLETLTSAVLGLVLIGTACYLGVEASLNIYYHTELHPTGLALVGAAVSIASKEALYQYTVFIGKRLKSQLIIANAWHHRSDSLSSVAVLLGVGGAIINPSWHILDAYATLIVSFFIIKVALDILRQALREFTDTAPEPEVLEEMRQCILGVQGVIGTHDIRVRTSGGLYQMEAHILVNGQITVIEGHKIAKDVEKCLNDALEDLGSVIVHVDPAVEEKVEKDNVSVHIGRPE